MSVESTVAKVVNRDGTQVNFDLSRIKEAITAASSAMKNKEDKLSKEEISSISEEVEKSIFDSDSEVTIETIQDTVITVLKNHNHINLADAYVKFREQRNVARIKNAKVMKEINKQLHPDKKKKTNQNANLDELSYGGRKGEATSTLLKYLAKTELMKEKDVEDLELNRRYPHDLDSFLLGEHNCLSCPIDQLFEEGFNTRQADIRPASSINTEFQLLAVVFQLQSLQQFGGVSATHLDISSEPYVRMSYYKHYLTVADIIPFINPDKIKANLNFDKFGAKKVSINDACYVGAHWYNFIKRYIAKKALKLTKKELKQAVEGMYHNLNTLQSRSGNQLEMVAA